MQFRAVRRWLSFSVAVFLINGAQAMAQPAAATLVSPTGEVQGSTTTFTWNAVPSATWYLFWVGSTSGVALEQWYTTQQAGCLSETGTCSVSLTLAIAPGAYNWYIRAWNPIGPGPWSSGKSVSIKELTPTWSRKLPNDRRFTLVLDGLAVLDNETGLTWERTPSENTQIWAWGSYNCIERTIAARQGWRLPSVAELQTLFDTSVGQLPPLSLGHPFVLGTLSGNGVWFWTATSSPFDTASVFVVNIYSARVFDFPKSSGPYRSFCVRGSGSERVAF